TVSLPSLRGNLAMLGLGLVEAVEAIIMMCNDSSEHVKAWLWIGIGRAMRTGCFELGNAPRTRQGCWLDFGCRNQRLERKKQARKFGLTEVRCSPMQIWMSAWNTRLRLASREGAPPRHKPSQSDRLLQNSFRVVISGIVSVPVRITRWSELSS